MFMYHKFSLPKCFIIIICFPIPMISSMKSIKRCKDVLDLILQINFFIKESLILNLVLQFYILMWKTLSP